MKRAAATIGSFVLIACGARSDIGDVYEIDAATTDSTAVDGATDGGVAPDVSCGIWPMTGHDPARTARSVLDGPRTANVLWSVPLDDPWPAAVAADGTVYVVDKANTLHAIGTNGVEVWSAGDGSTPSWLNTPIPPAVGCDGTIYVHGGITVLPSRYTVDDVIAARSPDGGAVLWSYAYVPDEPAGDSPVPLPSRIYYANHNLDTFTIDGGLEWSTPTFAFSNFAVDSMQTVYGLFAPFDDAGNFDDLGATVAAIDSSGNVLWSIPLPCTGVCGGPFLLSDDHTIITTASDPPDLFGGMYGLDTSGSILWRVPLLQRATGFPSMALAPNGDVYVTTATGLVAVTPSTRTQRSVLAGDQTNASVAIDASGVVYTVTMGQALVAIRPDDSVLFTFDPEDDTLDWGATALGDGVVYVSATAHLYAIGP